MPILLIELRSKISLSSKRIGWLEGVLHKETANSFVSEVLNLTKLWDPHSEIFLKSELIVEDVANQD